MKALGVTLLGLVLGAVIGMFATSAVARPLLEGAEGELSLGAAMLIGALTPGLAVIGAVVAVLVYFRSAAGE
jgi:hypothetical protein